MALVVGFKSEVTLPGLFDFVGTSVVGRLDEAVSPGGLTAGNIGPISTRLIQTDQPIRFRFNWDISGIFTHAFNPAFLWQIEILMEQMGPGEFTLGGAGKTVLTFGSGDLTGTTTHFPGVGAPGSTDIVVPPNTIPEGVYDVVAVIRLTHPAPSFTPCFLAAFAEYGKIEFYQEH